MLMIPQDEWQSLHEKLDRLIEIVEKTRIGSPGKDWFESDEVREILGISPQDVAKLPRPTPHPLLPDRSQNLRQPRRPRRFPTFTPNRFKDMNNGEF